MSTVGKAERGAHSYRCPCGETNPDKFYGKKNKVCKKCHNRYCTASGHDRRKRAIEFCGGKCRRCGYDRHMNAFDFHHVDPRSKDPRWTYMRGWNWERVKEHLAGCVLLCSNCHRELHAGMFGVGDLNPMVLIGCEK